MMRAAAKNHAWVTIVTSTEQYEPLLEELRANDGTVERGDAARARAGGVRAHGRVRRAIVQWLQEDELAARSTSMLALERTDETLRYGENPHQQAARYRAAGHDELVGRRAAARRSRALVPQLLRRRRGVAARARPR